MYIYAYCTISINLSGGVTCDQLDEISPPASQHVTWDKPGISANCQNLPKGGATLTRRSFKHSHVLGY